MLKNLSLVVFAICADGKYSEADVDKLRKGITPFIYICFLCKPNLSKNENNNKLLDIEELIKKYNINCVEKITNLKRNVENLTSETNDKAATIMYMKRKIDLLENLDLI